MRMRILNIALTLFYLLPPFPAFHQNLILNIISNSLILKMASQKISYTIFFEDSPGPIIHKLKKNPEPSLLICLFISFLTKGNIVKKTKLNSL
jgi:hypothetical protein